MTKGKVCAQCCHAAVGAVNRARKEIKSIFGCAKSYVAIYKTWCKSGCKKVALSCPDFDVFKHLCEEAERAGLVSYAVVC